MRSEEEKTNTQVRSENCNPTEPTTPHLPNGKPRDQVGSSGFLQPEETASPLLYPRRLREDQSGSGSGHDRQ